MREPVSNKEDKRARESKDGIILKDFTNLVGTRKGQYFGENVKR